MDRKYRLKITAILVALVVSVLILLVVPISANSGSGGSSDSNSFITFVPIWIAVFVPVFIAARQRREKAKREINIEDEDIYSVMNRLVDDLDDDEMDYLRQRLHDKFGDSLAG